MLRPPMRLAALNVRLLIRMTLTTIPMMNLKMILVMMQLVIVTVVVLILILGERVRVVPPQFVDQRRQSRGGVRRRGRGRRRPEAPPLGLRGAAEAP